jgi:hypothetical protein
VTDDVPVVAEAFRPFLTAIFRRRKMLRIKTEKTRLFRVFERTEEERLTKESKRDYAAHVMSSMARVPAEKHVGIAPEECVS